MKIKLYFPPESIDAIKGMGLRQMSPETLRWTANHPSSNYGLGVLLRGKSGEILDGRSFAAMVKAFGAWIEVDSEDTARRVHNALVTAATETEAAVKVNDLKKND
ncbi:hypothetical protein [Methylomonas rapida]|uniref:Uncharacterized protein n=1 Tax=Methylomonas rapida TaxID=2963939 RepID=A0ABY7GLX0_9GAMM|nr:hypothetical protein [Methylomonas rapida]WAR45495.1 hypothetical protein NM686_002985 [Methylomonas rapida]